MTDSYRPSYYDNYRSNSYSSSSSNTDSYNADPNWYMSKEDVAPKAPVTSTAIDFEKYDIPVETSGKDCPKSITSWDEVQLGSTIHKNIELSGYTNPTPVQKYSLPIVLAGRDLMSCAQTGSGKTAAFLLPILAQILKGGNVSRPGQKAYPSALVLAPTRELAVQIFEESKKFSYRTGMKSVVVYGGAPIGYQLRELERGCDVLVATPGRLVDILEKGKVSLSSIQYLVLDEADRMLDMGFEPQIRRIVEKEDMPRTGQRQTLMFSATFAKEIQSLASSYLFNYIFLTIGRVGSTTELVTQKFVRTQSELEKEKALLDILATSGTGLTLIFVERKKKASWLEGFLKRHRYSATSIHGDRSQQDRTAALRAFSSGQCQFLIATNVAARGLDISNVVHVVNYEMPTNIDDYVHRIGRTGRAGKSGVSTAFISDDDIGLASDLVKLLRGASQEVPDWLDQMRYMRKNGKGGMKPGFGGKPQKWGNNGGMKGSFGGRDFRSDFSKPPVPGQTNGPSTYGPPRPPAYPSSGYPPASGYPSAGGYPGAYGAPYAAPPMPHYSAYPTVAPPPPPMSAYPLPPAPAYPIPPPSVARPPAPPAPSHTNGHSNGSNGTDTTRKRSRSPVAENSDYKKHRSADGSRDRDSHGSRDRDHHSRDRHDRDRDRHSSRDGDRDRHRDRDSHSSSRDRHDRDRDSSRHSSHHRDHHDRDRERRHSSSRDR